MNSKEIAQFIGKRIWLRKLGYFIIQMTTLREWYIARALHKLLRNRKEAFSVLDAGFGMGQHTWHIARRYAMASVTGIELDAGQVDDFSHFLKATRTRNASVFAADISKTPLQGTFDIIVCCSVLEHIKDDLQLLRYFNTLLNDNGDLLLYIPTSEHRVFKRLGHKIETITKAAGESLPHGHERYDQPADLSAKVEKSGFQITFSEISYGPFGRLSYDLVTMVQVNRYFKLLFPFYFVFIHPFVMALMMVDFLCDNHEGNGFLMVAKKLSDPNVTR